jgi:uncharacterized protein YbbK (DUF523 family)
MSIYKPQRRFAFCPRLNNSVVAPAFHMAIETWSQTWQELRVLTSDRLTSTRSHKRSSASISWNQFSVHTYILLQRSPYLGSNSGLRIELEKSQDCYFSY